MRRGFKITLGAVFTTSCAFIALCEALPPPPHHAVDTQLATPVSAAQPASPKLMPVVTVQALGTSDLDQIVNASRRNEARFDRDYKGKHFDAILTFTSAKKGWFGDAMVSFNSALCSFDSEDILQQTIDWDKGRRVHVQGVIDDTILGSVSLKHCVIQ